MEDSDDTLRMQTITVNVPELVVLLGELDAERRKDAGFLLRWMLTLRLIKLYNPRLRDAGFSFVSSRRRNNRRDAVTVVRVRLGTLVDSIRAGDLLTLESRLLEVCPQSFCCFYDPVADRVCHLEAVSRGMCMTHVRQLTPSAVPTTAPAQGGQDLLQEALDALFAINQE